MGEGEGVRNKKKREPQTSSLKLKSQVQVAPSCLLHSIVYSAICHLGIGLAVGAMGNVAGRFTKLAVLRSSCLYRLAKPL